MANATIGLSPELHEYLLRVGVREPEPLRRLRERTAEMPEHNLQIAPEQGALMALLIELTAARRCIEVGTFTGYSATAVALALPADGRLVCCDVSKEWTDIARAAWEDAGVADKVELRLGPAVDSLDAMLTAGEREAYDFAFVDADKGSYAAYYDRLLQLLRPGGLIAFDNVLRHGDVVRPETDNPETIAIRQLNEQLAEDQRVSIALVPIADGLTLARKR
jgi:predicted O-methyltransferase YrrM